MNIVTKLLKIFFVILLVVIISAVVFVSVFDANEYKPEIIAQVEQATGRDFNIDGDIGLTLYPWIGLKLEKTSLGNAKGFSDKKFASLEQLNVKVNVLPLLKKEIEINKVQLQGLTLSLEVDKQGRNNWGDLAKQDKTATKTSDISEVKSAGKASASQTNQQQTQESTSPDASPALALESLKIEGFEFVEASVIYSDQQAGTRAKISDLNLQTGAISFDEPVDVKFHARIENNQPLLDSQIDLTTALTFNREFSTFNLRDLLLSVAMKANDMVAQDIALTLNTMVDVDMEKQKIAVKAMQLKVLDVTTVADITINAFQTAPVINGDISVAEFNARTLTDKLGIVLPEMANRQSLTAVSLSTKLKMFKQQLQLNNVVVQLDDSQLTGWLRIPDLGKQQIRYDFKLDKIDLNAYMPPVAEADTSAVTEPSSNTGSQPTAVAANKQAKNAGGNTGKNTSGQTSVGQKNTGHKNTGKDPADEKIELPVEMLRALDVQGVFAVKALHIQDYDVSNILIKTRTNKGVIVVDPIKLSVFDGQVVARTTLNVRKQTPIYTMKMNVKDVQAGPVVNPFLKNSMGDKPMQLQGAVNVAATVNSRGNTINTLKRKAKGKVTINMKKTAVKGFDPEYLVRSSIADYLDNAGLGSVGSVRGDYQPRKVTVFETIHDTAKINNGQVTTKDFLMDSKRVVIKAQGKADIMVNTMDVTASTKLVRNKTTLEKLLKEPLYVRIHGPFDALAYDVDTKKLSANVNNMVKAEAKAKAKAKLDAEKKKLQEKAKKEQNKLEDKLKNKLKNLF